MYMFFIVKSRNASILLKIDNNKFRSELFLRCLLTEHIKITENFWLAAKL